MDIVTIGGALSSANTAFNIIRTAVGATAKAETTAAVTSLNDALLRASQAALILQEKIVALESEKAQLEKEIARLKRTHHHFEDYRLRDVETGAFVYAYEPAVKGDRADAQPPKPPHWLCVPCFEDGYTSILQLSEGKTDIFRHVFYRCPKCHKAISVDIETTPAGIKPLREF